MHWFAACLMNSSDKPMCMEACQAWLQLLCSAFCNQSLCTCPTACKDSCKDSAKVHTSVPDHYCAACWQAKCLLSQHAAAIAFTCFVCIHQWQSANNSEHSCNSFDVFNRARSEKENEEREDKAKNRHTMNISTLILLLCAWLGLVASWSLSHTYAVGKLITSWRQLLSDQETDSFAL